MNSDQAELLGGMLRAGRITKNWSQLELSELTQVSPATISSFETCSRLPSVSQLLQLAQHLDLELRPLMLALLWQQLHDEDIADLAASDGPPPQQQIEELLQYLKYQIQDQAHGIGYSRAPEGGPISLANWRRTLRIRTIIVGDRREDPPHTIADLLALTGSTCDLSYVGELALRGARIRSDKIVKLADPHELRRLLAGDILVVGSPAANLAAREVNKTACCRFHVPREASDLEQQIERDLTPIRYDPDALAAYATKHRAKIRQMLYNFARPGFVDPVDFQGRRGIARNMRRDYAVVTICRNPWSPQGIAILAAGIGGPGTAAALKLLATESAFETHPLGGVFQVTVATEAPWAERYDFLKPAWDSHEHTLGSYLNDLQQMLTTRRDIEGALTAESVQEIESLLALLQNRGDATAEPVENG